MRFEQGKWYPFSIAGLIDVPDKGDHYMLLHESGRKMLLKREYYVKYNFSMGQIIQCRVDKVNCTGQVFMEPKHPLYNDNQIYSFEIIQVGQDKNLIFNAKVKDIFGNLIDVYINQVEKLQANESVKLKVHQIKKGIPVLGDLQDDEPEDANVCNECEIKLQIISIENYNAEDYYILSDRLNLRTKIKVKHYQKWGFNIGDEILCKAIGHDLNNQIAVEPVNPWYIIGKAYAFKIIGLEDYVDLEGKIAKSIVVLDAVNNKCGVKISNIIEKKFQIKDEILCKVVGFRKGRPQLEIDLH